MTEAGWTRNADVKESGFYWLVWAERLPQVVQVREASVHFTSGLTISLEEVNGQFLGPITPDSFQQGRVAGARECVEKVRARAALWRAHGGAKIGFPYGHLTVEGECDSIADELGKFARQAQEGGVRDGKEGKEGL